MPPAGDFPDSFQAVAYDIFFYPRRRFLVGQRERHHAESVKPIRMGFQYPAQFRNRLFDAAAQQLREMERRADPAARFTPRFPHVWNTA